MHRALLILLMAAVATPAAAQIGLYNDPVNPDVGCNFIDAYQPYPIYIVVVGSWRGARFSLHDTNMAAFLDIQPMNGVTMTGDMTTGIVLTFPQCMSGRYAVARVDQINNGNCVPLQLSPHPNAASGQVELIDCAGHSVVPTWMPVVTGRAFNNFNCDPPGLSAPPDTPFPANGATNLALSPLLSWSILPPISCTLAATYASVYFGTSANPPIVASDWDQMQFAVGPLQPGTTYYWKILQFNRGVPVLSPVWSFTTAGPVATRQSTWGTIKALYR